MTSAADILTAAPVTTAEKLLEEERRDRALGRRYQPTGDRVLVKRAPHVRQVGLIAIVGGKREHMAVSKVLARGPEVKMKPWHLAPGDHVLHPRLSGVKIDVVLARQANQSEEGDLVVLHEEELICVVDPELVNKVEGEIDCARDGSRDLAKL